MTDFTMQKGDDGVAVITWDVPGKSMNVLSFDGAGELDRLMDDALADDAVKGIVITSGKDDFAGGMDLNAIAGMKDAGGAQGVFDGVMSLHALLRKIERAGMDPKTLKGGKPVAAALTGTALGIGLELPLATHRIFAAPKGKIGLPEIRLGLFPGWAGIFDLPRLIGPEQAVTVIFENPLNSNRTLTSEQAREAGILDALTEDGTEKVERILESAGLLEGANLYDFENTQVVHHLNQALRANVMFKRDVDYLVKDGKVIIIDEFTGRMMDGRRWSDGLHQAVEAKEGVQIEPENQTMASITFQNYFRMYPKLSGMTGTASTEAAEFFDIYKMNVVTIPTNRPINRVDEEDEFYKDTHDKFRAIAKKIREHASKGQPVLVGTVSIEKSELLSEFLTQEGVDHSVLNARYHESEAHIVAQAGRLSAVTIATNMAGRGTDIQLGGNLEFRVEDELAGMAEGPEREAAIEQIRQEIAAEKARVLEAGGLFVLGTERHESRRIDNQLRGRSGRQGDPGLSRFYLSLEDDLLRIFGPDTLFARMMRSNLEDGEAIGSKWLTKAIETAQKKVEARNYDVRKQVVEYDDVMNDQRKVIYEQRADIMDADTVGDVVEDMRAETVNAIVGDACPPNSYPEQWDIEGMKTQLAEVLNIQPPVDEWLKEEAIDPEIVTERVQAEADAMVAAKAADLEPETWTQVEKSILLQNLDHHWKEHLATLDALRQVVHLRAYAQKTPINEYKQEAFSLFQRMLDSIRVDVTKTIAQAQFRMEPLPELPELPDFITTHFDPFTGEDNSADVDAGTLGLIQTQLPPMQMVQPGPIDVGDDPAQWEGQVSRNAPCPCGSGRKYKHCHGAV